MTPVASKRCRSSLDRLSLPDEGQGCARWDMTSVASICAITAIALFTVMWVICYRVRNYGFLDVTWTLAIGLLAAICGIAGPGNAQRRWAFTLIGMVWSLRLGLFVLARVWRHHPTEDKRYRSLRERWTTPLAFLLFFELQALVAVVFSTPFLIAAFDDSPSMGALECIGLFLAMVGILGEAIADRQAALFKGRQDKSHPVLDTGLWRYSRHPNYFFEMLVWIGFALAVLNLRLGWIAISCPLLMCYFLLRVTGIPLTEKHSLETHGDAYRNYQRRTSVLIPWAMKRARGGSRL
jgi:steroid 5-alpha reductase family enzyme